MAKSQVIRAQALQDRTQAYLAGYSSKNRVLFGLMTTPYHELQEQGWNFHGEPFVVNNNATTGKIIFSFCETALGGFILINRSFFEVNSFINGG